MRCDWDPFGMHNRDWFWTAQEPHDHTRQQEEETCYCQPSGWGFSPVLCLHCQEPPALCPSTQNNPRSHPNTVRSEFYSEVLSSWLLAGIGESHLVEAAGQNETASRAKPSQNAGFSAVF